LLVLRLGPQFHTTRYIGSRIDRASWTYYGTYLGCLSCQEADL